MIAEEVLRAQLSHTLERTHLDRLGTPYVGKVRDNYSRDGRRIIVATDRVSAFDRVLGTIPFKGQVLNQLSAYWFEATRDVCPNHVIEVPDPQVTIARECRLLPVEMVVRAYLTGVTTTSIWYAYERGARQFSGYSLPDGLRKNQRLERPLVTPTTKAQKGDHDRPTSRAEIVARGTVTAAEYDEMADKALALFAFGQKTLEARGLILVDTKYEFGRDPEGRIVVIDEIHTSDSSRFWRADSYAERFARAEEPESLDKEYLRRWLLGMGYQGEGPPPALTNEVRVEAARRYITAYQQITGRSFVADTADPAARIARNLETSRTLRGIAR